MFLRLRRGGKRGPADENASCYDCGHNARHREVRRDMHEIRWHGRGGQGAVTSAKILADAAFRSGFAGVTSQPSFGAERRGAPITASTRLSDEPLRILSQVTEPDIIVVLDESLLEVANVTAGMKPGGTIIVNSAKAPDEFAVRDDLRVVTSDVTGAARAVDLIVGGQPMVSTAILGAFARATGLVTMDNVEAAIAHTFSGSAARKNVEAAKIAFECTRA
jgi:2-oxoacid:acceptor oxidoreductase gamma subunit (pyruvate/2-ketoisovalerate family)